MVSERKKEERRRNRRLKKESNPTDVESWRLSSSIDFGTRYILSPILARLIVFLCISQRVLLRATDEMHLHSHKNYYTLIYMICQGPFS